MEAAVENVTLLLRKAGRSQNKNTAENAAAEVASAACSRAAASVSTLAVSQRLLRMNRVARCCTSATSDGAALQFGSSDASEASSPLLALWTP